MSKFLQEMESVAVPKHVKDDLDAPLEANVHSQFRGGVGQLQWLQLQGNPLLRISAGGSCQCRHPLSGSQPRTQLGRTALMDHPRVM